MIERDLKNETIFITGANRGIGRALVEVALKAGAKKIYAAARQPEQLKNLIAEAKGRVVPIALDVTSAEQITSAAKQATDVTFLINNAGIAAYSGFSLNYRPNGAHQEMAVNYFGPLNLSRAFIPILKKNSDGTIMNILSVASFASFPFAASYCSSKAAAHLLTHGLRAELVSQGVFVTGVYPGPVDTDMAKDAPMEKTPPEDIALNAFQGWQKGDEDIFPDKFSAQFIQAYRKDAKAVEKENAAAIAS